MAPDVAGSRAGSVIEVGAGAVDGSSPLRAERVVDHERQRLEGEGADDQIEEAAEQPALVPLAVREEAVVGGHTAPQSAKGSQAPNRSLPGAQEPGHGGRQHEGPGPLGERDPRGEDDFLELRRYTATQHGLTSDGKGVCTPVPSARSTVLFPSNVNSFHQPFREAGNPRKASSKVTSQ